MIKTIKISKNKLLNYTIRKDDFTISQNTVLVNKNCDININLRNPNQQNTEFLVGDRLLELATFFDYFIPSGELDVDSLKIINATQTAGSGLTNIQIVKGTSNNSEETGTWLSKIENDLQVITPKGNTNTFIFTYNGSTWDITGALTLAGQTLSDYGISFEGTATNGNIITVTETHYNRFACFVLDSAFRTNAIWSSNSSDIIMPKQYPYNNYDCIESATFFNNWIIKNVSNINSYPAFKYCYNLGSFVINGIKLNPVLPTTNEISKIYKFRNILDYYDPITRRNPTAQYNLTDWTNTTTCLEANYYQIDFCNSTGKFSTTYKTDSLNIKPILEVPTM